MKRTILLLVVALVFLPLSSWAGPDGQSVYRKSCGFCHDSGVAGAPRLGDRAAWEPRLARGVGQLTRSVVEGKGAMPPKGGNAGLGESEIRAAVDFMIDRAR